MRQLRNIRALAAAVLVIGLVAACGSSRSTSAQSKHSTVAASPSPIPLPNGIIIAWVNPQNSHIVYGCAPGLYAMTIPVSGKASYGKWEIAVTYKGISKDKEGTKHKTKFDFQVPLGHSEFSGFVNYIATNGIEEEQSVLHVILKDGQKDSIELDTPSQINWITVCLPAETKEI